MCPAVHRSRTFALYVVLALPKPAAARIGAALAVLSSALTSRSALPAQGPTLSCEGLPCVLLVMKQMPSLEVPIDSVPTGKGGNSKSFSLIEKCHNCLPLIDRC